MSNTVRVNEYLSSDNVLEFINPYSIAHIHDKYMQYYKG